MAIEIRVASEAADIQAIQRQRYQIYIEELRYAQPHACAITRTIAEPLDERSVLFGAFYDGRIVGSVRLTFASAHPLDGGPAWPAKDEATHVENFGPYTAMYRLRAFERWYPHAIGIVTKLMIAPEHRCGTLLARISLALYRYTRDTWPHVRFCVIDCVPPLERYYLRLGYRRIGPPIQHPAAGWVLPMAFALYDRRHFVAVRSPLARACPRHDTASSAWFQRMIVQRSSSAPAESIAS